MDYDYPPWFGGSLHDAWKEIHRLQCKNRRSLREVKYAKECLRESLAFGLLGWVIALWVFLWRAL